MRSYADDIQMPLLFQPGKIDLFIRSTLISFEWECGQKTWFTVQSVQILCFTRRPLFLFKAAWRQARCLIYTAGGKCLALCVTKEVLGVKIDHDFGLFLHGTYLSKLNW